MPHALAWLRSAEEFDVVVAFEERVFEQIIDGAMRAMYRPAQLCTDLGSMRAAQICSRARGRGFVRCLC